MMKFVNSEKVIEQELQKPMSSNEENRQDIMETKIMNLNTSQNIVKYIVILLSKCKMITIEG